MEFILICGFVVVVIFLEKFLIYLKNLDKNLRILITDILIFGNTATYEKKLEYMKRSKKGEAEYIYLMNLLEDYNREANRILLEK